MDFLKKMDLCFGSYSKILVECKNKNVTQKRIVRELLSLVTDDYDDSDTAISKLVGGFNNLPVHIISEANQKSENDYIDFISTFETQVIPLIDPNKLAFTVMLMSILIAEDVEIDESTVINIITGKKKRELNGTTDDPAQFLSGILLYVIRSTDNRREKGFINEVVCKCRELSDNYTFCFANNDNWIFRSSDNTCLERPQLALTDEEIEREATVFCIKHDSEKSLIPLCQMAQLTNPIHKHARAMYNDYCSCAKSVQKKILELNNIEKILNLHPDWWYSYLNDFIDDYKKYQLGDERYIYTFTQYFPRILQYDDYPVEQFRDYIFTPKVTTEITTLFPDHKLNVIGLIDEYVYYKDIEGEKENIEPPMNYMWRELDFGSCPEPMLIMWLAMFIIGTCCSLPEETIQEIDLPTLEEIQNAEDLFYMTILMLYDRYKSLD